MNAAPVRFKLRGTARSQRLADSDHVMATPRDRPRLLQTSAGISLLFQVAARYSRGIPSPSIIL